MIGAAPTPRQDGHSQAVKRDAGLSRAAFHRAHNYLLACLSEWLAPALRRYAASRTGPPISSPKDWRRALILGDNHLGDILYRTGSLGPLQRGLPNCEFYYLTAPGSAEILAHCPHLAGVLPLCRGDSRLDLDSEAIRTLSSLRFDAALCTNAVHYTQDLRLALQLRIPARAGYVFKGFSAWVTHPIRVTYPQPFPGYFRQMVAQLTGTPPDWPLRPAITTTAADRSAADALWSGLKLEPTRPTLACFVTSRQPSGVWPLERFAQAVLKILAAAPETQIVLCGAAGDAPLLRELAARYQLPAAINAGLLSIRPLAEFLRRCTVVLSTDSGPRHIANAAEVPVVFVRNLLFNKVEAGAYCDTDHDLAVDAEMLAPGEQRAFLERTSTDAVAAEVLQVLQRAQR